MYEIRYRNKLGQWKHWQSFPKRLWSLEEIKARADMLLAKGWVTAINIKEHNDND